MLRDLLRDPNPLFRLLALAATVALVLSMSACGTVPSRLPCPTPPEELLAPLRDPIPLQPHADGTVGLEDLLRNHVDNAEIAATNRRQADALIQWHLRHGERER